MNESEKIMDAILAVIRYANECGFNNIVPQERFHVLRNVVQGEVMDTYTTAASIILATISLIPQAELEKLPKLEFKDKSVIVNK